MDKGISTNLMRAGIVGVFGYALYKLLINSGFTYIYVKENKGDYLVINGKEPSTMTINGKSYTGKNIKLTIDGETVPYSVESTTFNISIIGNPEHITSMDSVQVTGNPGNVKAMNSVKITGNCKDIHAQGSVNVQGSCSDIKTQSSVTVGGNSGKISTMGKVTIYNKE